MIKKIYVSVIKLIYKIFNFFGLIYLLNKYKTKQPYHWLLSLFYIWDIKGLISLDCPWWTYSAINEIEMFIKDKKKLIVFEYGSGASSVWLAKRVYKLYSVEHNVHWFNEVKNHLKPFKNIYYQLIPPSIGGNLKNYDSKKEIGLGFYKYVKSIKSLNIKFDIIVIDGRSRNACLKESLLHLKKNGIIIFDNCNRKRYKKEISKLKNKINFYYGLTPSLPYSECTAIIHNENEVHLL